ncbi:hypothetical protein EIP86_010910 [Pleurotus ostreatoroseus]|nr:hypothetical protein EIP86_010910 [Pleurotus ostreatoroseus]
MASMLSSLFRFFQPVPLPDTEGNMPPPPSAMRKYERNGERSSEQHTVYSEKGKQREVPGQTRSDGVPLERKPSFFSMDRTTQGPPHIAWVIPTPNPTPVGSPNPGRRSWPPKPGNRSSTPLSLAEGPSHSVDELNVASSSPGVTQLPGRRTSNPLDLHSMHYLGELITESETSSTNPSISLNTNKPLPSPVDMHFPPADAKSSESVPLTPLTPDSTRLPTPTTPGFLSRPLKRTISSTSSSTFGTMSSLRLVPPSIPPLDLRPNFSGSLGAPSRRSQLAAPSLPTVVGSPRPQVSIIYEGDSDPADSFRTALSLRNSLATPTDPEYGRSPIHDPFADPTDAGGSDDGRSWIVTDNRNSGTDFSRTEQSHMSISEDAYDEIDLGVPNTDSELTPIHPHPHSLSRFHNQEAPSSSFTSILETMSRRSQGSNDTMVESAIKRRWLLGLSFGSYRTDRGTWEPGKRARMTSACVLFWLGFIAPWCWLIGGWYLAPSGEMKPDGQLVNDEPSEEAAGARSSATVLESETPGEVGGDDADVTYRQQSLREIFESPQRRT